MKFNSQLRVCLCVWVYDLNKSKIGEIFQTNTMRLCTSLNRNRKTPHSSGLSCKWRRKMRNGILKHFHIICDDCALCLDLNCFGFSVVVRKIRLHKFPLFLFLLFFFSSLLPCDKTIRQYPDEKRWLWCPVSQWVMITMWRPTFQRHPYELFWMVYAKDDVQTRSNALDWLTDWHTPLLQQPSKNKLIKHE